MHINMYQKNTWLQAQYSRVRQEREAVKEECDALRAENAALKEEVGRVTREAACGECGGPMASDGGCHTCIAAVLESDIERKEYEIAEKDAEIERLKEEVCWQKEHAKEMRARNDNLHGVYHNVVNDYRRYKSRSRAWKWCALMWRDDVEIIHPDQRVGHFIAHRFERVDGELDTSDWATCRITKPSPAWREEAAAYLRGEIELTDNPPTGEKG